MQLYRMSRMLIAVALATAVVGCGKATQGEKGDRRASRSPGRKGRRRAARAGRPPGSVGLDADRACQLRRHQLHGAMQR